MDTGRMVKYREDEIILKEGDESSILYKIISGKAAIYKSYGQEDEYLIGVLADQKYFGETGFLAKVPSPYTVVALSETLVMNVSEEGFEDYVYHNTKNAVDIMRQLAKNIVTLNAHIEMMGEDMSELSEALSKAKGPVPVKIDIREKLQRYRCYGI